MIRSKDKYHAWERMDGESYKEFQKRLHTVYKKTMNTECKKEERKLEKIMRFRAWEQMPGESRKDFKKRLKSEKRTII